MGKLHNKRPCGWRIRPGLMPVPILDFSKPIRRMTDDEYLALEREIAEASTREAMLARIAYYKAHRECLVGLHLPYSFEEYECRVLAGEFD